MAARVCPPSRERRAPRRKCPRPIGAAWWSSTILLAYKRSGGLNEVEERHGSERACSEICRQQGQLLAQRLAQRRRGQDCDGREHDRRGHVLLGISENIAPCL